MNCYPIIETDSSVQIGDKLRIDVSKTFVSRPDNDSAITKVEVKPTDNAGFIVVHNTAAPSTTYAKKDWYLDWIYNDNLVGVTATKNHTITLKVTLSDLTTFTKTQSISVLTESEDGLLSSDADLFLQEWDIMKWVPDGKSSWKYMHRRSKDRILSYLDEKGYTTDTGERITLANLYDKSELKEWSVYMTLYLIFSTVLNSRGDVFTKKAEFYENKEARANNRIFMIDSDANGEKDGSINLASPMLVRR